MTSAYTLSAGASRFTSSPPSGFESRLDNLYSFADYRSGNTSRTQRHIVALEQVLSAPGGFASPFTQEDVPRLYAEVIVQKILDRLPGGRGTIPALHTQIRSFVAEGAKARARNKLDTGLMVPAGGVYVPISRFLREHDKVQHFIPEYIRAFLLSELGLIPRPIFTITDKLGIVRSFSTNASLEELCFLMAEEAGNDRHFEDKVLGYLNPPYRNASDAMIGVSNAIMQWLSSSLIFERDGWGIVRMSSPVIKKNYSQTMRYYMDGLTVRVLNLRTKAHWVNIGGMVVLNGLPVAVRSMLNSYAGDATTGNTLTVERIRRIYLGVMRLRPELTQQGYSINADEKPGLLLLFPDEASSFIDSAALEDKCIRIAYLPLDSDNLREVLNSKEEKHAEASGS